MGVEVTVPATIANLGPGFDTLALAVHLHDRFNLALDTRTSATFQGAGAEGLAREPGPLVVRAATAVARATGRDAGFRIETHGDIPVARGLGSSAAAIVGGLVGANHLLGAPLSQDRLLALAADLEGHPDNVAAALLGGVVAVAGGPELRWVRFLPRLDLDIVLAIPDFEVSTSEARAILPPSAPLSDAVFNVGRTALLVSALLTGDETVLPLALDDRLHQPYRARLIPGMSDVFQAARDAGAHGAVLSGSGPTLAALTSPEAAVAVGEAMVAAFARHEVRADARITQTDPHGAVVHE